MTSVRVIILAQGEQRRLPDLKVPKQLLELPACDNVTILERTLLQVRRICSSNGTELRNPMVVAGDAIRLHARSLRPMWIPNVFTLDDPGNSSLKGIHRYLTGISAHDPVADHNVVLLGDVIYSWQCLRALLRSASFFSTASMITFVGTSDLGASGGELWGVSWNDIADDQMMTMLDRAVRKHPQFDAYQPGQMRRWLWEYPESLALIGRPRTFSPDVYTAIDDYTRDIDLPEHVTQLPALSERAAEDDRLNGVVW